MCILFSIIIWCWPRIPTFSLVLYAFKYRTHISILKYYTTSTSWKDPHTTCKICMMYLKWFLNTEISLLQFQPTSSSLACHGSNVSFPDRIQYKWAFSATILYTSWNYAHEVMPKIKECSSNDKVLDAQVNEKASSGSSAIFTLMPRPNTGRHS